MPKISTFLPVAAIAAFAATAAPALAAPGHRDGPAYQSRHQSQHYAGFGQAVQLRRDIASLDARIDRALARRAISAREAFGLRKDVRELNRLYNRFAQGGLTRWEARTLETRLAEANRSLRFERRDSDRRRG